MTTPYAVSTNIGSVSYNNYVNAPITGPLSTNQTPCQIPYHSYGTLTGLRPTPPQFYPSQEPVYSDMNTNARYRYLRANVSNQDKQRQLALGKATTPLTYFTQSTNRYAAVSSHFNYIVPIPSSMRTDILKANAVGQTAYKVNLPNSAPTSTKNYYPSGIRTTLNRVRSGGCTPCKKKGSIYNTSLSNGKTCAWGSIVRQNY
jgi:hypothetical protein